MASILIEAVCPQHGLERYKVKIVKKYNMETNTILPKFRTRPKYELGRLIVGRNVKEKEIVDYLVSYYAQKGLMQNITSIRYNV